MKYKDIPWLPQDEYKKAMWQFGSGVRGVLGVFKMYGMDIYIDGAIKEIKKLAEDFSLRTRGIDKPISIDYIRRKK